MLMHHHFMCWPNVDTRPSIHAGVCSVWGLGSLGAAWAQEEVLWQLRWEIQMRSNGGRSHNWFIHQHNTTHFRYLLYLPSTIYSDHTTEMWVAFVGTHNGGFSFSSNLWNIFYTCVVVLTVTPGAGRLQGDGALHFAVSLVSGFSNCDIDIHNIRRISF